MSEQWTDDEIVGAILAGGSERPIKPQLGSFGQIGNVRWQHPALSRTPSSHLPCCAVGAGLLFQGLRIKDNQATEAFAKKYGVSRTVAQGVSDGFEQCEWNAPPEASRDYARGWAIGAAVRSAIEADEVRP